MVHQVVYLHDGAIREVEKILDSQNKNPILLVVDEIAYSVSGAEAQLEPLFSQHTVARFTGFEMNPKLEDVERGVQLYRDARPDMVIAIGGGTAIDLAKLICAVADQEVSALAVIQGDAEVLQNRPPLIAIPTTAGTGSEATHFAVAYVQGEKFSLAHPSLLPDFAIIDPMLTHSLPANMTAATGLDAFCQAIESIWAVGATDESLAYAQESADLALKHLVNATCNPQGDASAARHGMAKASHLAGKAINISKTTASHAMSYAITTQFGIPHGIAVALTLSPVLAFNSQVTSNDCSDPRGPEHVFARIGMILDLLGVKNVPAACKKIEKLIFDVGCPSSLSQAGITSEEEIQGITRQVNAHRLSNNPRKASPKVLAELLISAASQPQTFTAQTIMQLPK